MGQDTEHKWIRDYTLNFLLPDVTEVNISSVDQLTPLNIIFNIENDGTSKRENGMQLSIFGLTETTIGKIIAIGTQVIFQVGHQSASEKLELTTLFIGEVASTKVINDGQKNEVRFFIRASQLGSKPMLITLAKGVTYEDRIKSMLSFAREKIPDLNVATAETELKSLVKDDPSKAQAASLGISDKTLLSDEVRGTLSTSKTILAELAGVCSVFSIIPKVSRGILHLVRKGGELFSNDPISAVLGSNLLSPPLKRMDNSKGPVGAMTAFQMYDMDMLLTPNIDLNSVVISDHSRRVTGGVEKKPISIKVVKVTHTGTYYGGAWETKISGTAPDEKVLKEVTGHKSINEEYYDPGSISAVNRRNTSNIA